MLLHAGDTVTFELASDGIGPGTAWLRSNLHGAAIRRTEIVAATEHDVAPLDRDWFDTPMERAEDGNFYITVPVSEPGFFQAKTLFLPENSTEPVWPEGQNVSIKVEPASRKTGNSFYSAFTRLFGSRQNTAATITDDDLEDLDKQGYTVIPPSGTFRDLIQELDTIIDHMGFRNLLLLPIHPTPTTYARMGRFGSPFAALDLMDVDPALAEFDRKTTPLDQFRELIDATHAHGASLFMDMPLNHTGWASALQIHHPSWFVRNRTKHFQSPGAWGVTWEDLAELNYENKDLWAYMADVFLFWCKHGADGFRCDAGYMVPAEVWKYITAKVRRQFPDTVFLLEGLGGKKEVTRQLLSSANLDWAYSELFQNYDRTQIETYLHASGHVSKHTGLLMHFAETHDNDRLAAESPAYSKMRTALCALLSHQGAFGITCGVEWLATHKIDIHERTDLNWGSEDNQLDYIQHINILLNTHPAFASQSDIQAVHSGDANTLAVLRTTPSDDGTALVLINLDSHHTAHAEWTTVDGLNTDACVDLLTGLSVPLEERGANHAVQLAPHQVLCLSSDHTDCVAKQPSPCFSPESEMQLARAKAIEITELCSGNTKWTADTPSKLARELIDSPQTFFKTQALDCSLTLTTWRWPEDTRRTVPIPQGSPVLILAPHPFRADVIADDRVIERNTSIQGKTGYFTICTRTAELEGVGHIAISVFSDGSANSSESDVLFLGTAASDTPVALVRMAKEIRELESSALCTNGRGAMALVQGAWGDLRSQYDALLAGNLHASAPSDRHVMLTRCRAWLLLRGYSQEINLDCLTSFASKHPDTAEWLFSIPSGMGWRVCLRASLRMTQGSNSIDLQFERISDPDLEDLLAPDTEATLILRFDVEDRSFHTKTKAFTGPEERWPGLIESREDGFTFKAAPDRVLSVNSTKGKFTPEHEWSYMVDHPADRERGLDGHTDLFSPGFFSIGLKGGEKATIGACINGANEAAPPQAGPAPESGALSEVLKSALSQYVVARDSSQTVIAGYPWFLDWGRDTLICLRGMIACGMLEASRDILIQFASFEDHGTIPNMIRGDDVSNRDTSDAPLWLHVATHDLIAGGDKSILDMPCAGRSFKEILVSIAENYIAGTPNGIKVDPDSGLVFSPSHFTWMDTNHPAGTPREGYPIEIQALWYRSLNLLASITEDKKWKALAVRVQRSIANLYFVESRGWLSDCLHCAPGTPASNAVADDHLRPNQLFAITLGALEDKTIGNRVLDACQQLLVPGAIRTLADRPVDFKLPISANGKDLNDSERPYWGLYTGDEDTRRKPAYHNGTAWTWPFPSYCEALIKLGGPDAAPVAKSYLSGMLYLMEANCIGQIPEILDGDAPHTEKGCTAQAWGISEFARVLSLLESIS